MQSEADLACQAYLAAVKGDMDSVTRIVPSSVDPNTPIGVTQWDQTLMHVASATGNLPLAEYLLRHGADVNASEVHRPDRGRFSAYRETATDEEARGQLVGRHQSSLDRVGGGSPLHLAATCGKMEMLQWLIAHGAKLDTTNRRGEKPLDAAISEKQWDVARHLISLGVTYTTPNRMPSDQVSDFKSLNEFVTGLTTEVFYYWPLDPTKIKYDATLEEFLRSLWRVTYDLASVPLTWSAIAGLLEQAFSAQPMGYNSAWALIKRTPESKEARSDFDHYRNTILYQIADLRRLRAEGYYKRNDLFGGSEGWYNWYVEDFIGCAFVGLMSWYENSKRFEEFPESFSRDRPSMREHRIKMREMYKRPSWDFLASFLSFGQSYE